MRNQETGCPLEQALQQLGAVAEEIRQYRRDLLLATRGMKAFLSVPANFDLDREWESQWEILEHDLGNRAHFGQVEAPLDGTKDTTDAVAAMSCGRKPRRN